MKASRFSLSKVVKDSETAENAEKGLVLYQRDTFKQEQAAEYLVFVYANEGASKTAKIFNALQKSCQGKGNIEIDPAKFISGVPGAIADIQNRVTKAKGIKQATADKFIKYIKILEAEAKAELKGIAPKAVAPKSSKAIAETKVAEVMRTAIEQNKV